MSLALRRAVIAAALADLRAGVTEHPPGSNRGQRVDEMIRNCGLDPPAAWCAAAVSTWMKEGAAALGVPNRVPMSASSSFFYRWGRDNGRLTTNPQPGDIGLVPGGPTGYIHTVFAKGRLFGLVRTIEGNSNAAGAPEGGSVVANWRRVKHLKWVKALP